MRGRGATSTLVGREAPLEGLLARADRARGGFGQIGVLAGPAGIGKTRLATEIAARAEGDGFTVTAVQCDDLDRARPFSPLRRFGAGRPAIDDGESIRELAAALLVLPAAGPALLLVEDVHWADEATLLVLRRVIRAVGDLAFLVLLTLRSDEAAPELGPLLAALERQPNALRLDLRPLAEGETAELIAALAGAGAAPPRRFVERVHLITEGNPLFIEEVVGAVDVDPARGYPDPAEVDLVPVPRSVQAAVWQRCQRLSPPARRLLQLAAVAGRNADVDVLAALAGLDEPDLVAQLRELLATGLVVEESADRIAFGHELVRRAVTADLLARERRALHRAMAEEIVGQHGDDPSYAAPLARHYWESEAWREARDRALAGGDHASLLGAARAAVDLFSMAADASAKLGEPAPARALQGRAAAYEIAGDLDLARADREQLREAARRGQDGAAECAALLDLGGLWTARDYGRAGDHFRRALELARGLDRPDVLASCLNRIGSWRLNSDDPVAAEVHHREALALCQADGDGAGVAATLDLLGTLHLTIGDLVAATAEYSDAAQRFRAYADAPRLASALAMATFCAPQYLSAPATWAGSLSWERAVLAGEESIAVCRDLHWRAGEALGHFGLASVQGQHGRYGEALAHVTEGIRLADEVEHTYWSLVGRLVLGAVRLDLLDLEAAREALQAAYDAASALGADYWQRTVCGPLVEACLLFGDRTAARRVIGPVVKGDDPPPGTLTMGARHAWRAAAELALAGGDHQAAARIVDRLHAAISVVGPPGPAFELLRGRTLASAGQRAAAEDVWSEALTQCEGTPSVLPLAWRLHAALGRSRRATRHLDQAEEHFAAARAQIDALSDSLPDGADRRDFQARAHASLPSPSARQSTKQRYGGLTAREQEVAALVAEGLTNPEIADHLFLSPRTVEKHVEHVLAKLGAETRAQVAAWAVRSGLASEAKDT